MDVPDRRGRAAGLGRLGGRDAGGGDAGRRGRGTVRREDVRGLARAGVAYPAAAVGVAVRQAALPGVGVDGRKVVVDAVVRAASAVGHLRILEGSMRK